MTAECCKHPSSAHLWTNTPACRSPNGSSLLLTGDSVAVCVELLDHFLQWNHHLLTHPRQWTDNSDSAHKPHERKPCQWPVEWGIAPGLGRGLDAGSWLNGVLRARRGASAAAWDKHPKGSGSRGVRSLLLLTAVPAPLGTQVPSHWSYTVAVHT